MVVLDVEKGKMEERERERQVILANLSIDHQYQTTSCAVEHSPMTSNC